MHGLPLLCLALEVRRARDRHRGPLARGALRCGGNIHVVQCHRARCSSNRRGHGCCAALAGDLGEPAEHGNTGDDHEASPDGKHTRHGSNPANDRDNTLHKQGDQRERGRDRDDQAGASQASRCASAGVERRRQRGPHRGTNRDRTLREITSQHAGFRRAFDPNRLRRLGRLGEHADGLLQPNSVALGREVLATAQIVRHQVDEPECCGDGNEQAAAEHRGFHGPTVWARRLRVPTARQRVAESAARQPPSPRRSPEQTTDAPGRP